MAHEIITALIGIIPALIVAMTSVVSNSKIIKVKLDALEKQADAKIDALDRKVEKHNQIVERTYKLESDIATAFTKVDENRSRIERLENKEMDK
jgi:hypothetical protein